MSELLPAWDEIKDEADWTGLLVGNGSSLAVSPAFGYGSLYDVADLNVDDTSLFDAFETQNFEQVLAALKTAGVVAGVLGMDVEVLADRYVSIQRALFDAVHAVHVPWEAIGRTTIPSLFDALRTFRFVYSTNYDLLLYWASMKDGGSEFLDFLWSDGNTFDSSRTTVFRDYDHWTRIFFLHGGIHLRRLRSGGTRKVVARDGAILEQFRTDYDGDDSPLLVSEGESTDKLSSINSSDYLSFAYQMFAAHEGGLVLFGHSLRDEDDHLVRPLKALRYEPIAISMLLDDDEERLIQKQDRFKSLVSPRKNVHFFDATTHPLGAPALQVKERGILDRFLGR